MRRGSGAGSGADRAVAAAQVLDRVAVLVRAGIPAARAWAAVAERDEGGLGAVLAPVTGSGAPPGAELAAVLARVGGGEGVGARPRPGPGDRSGPDDAVWPAVGAVWRVAERTGAPVADTLDALAVAVRDVVATRRAVDVALAGPRTSGRVVLALPLVGVVFGLAQGPAALLVLLTTPLGWGLVGTAGLLVAIASRWTGELVRRASARGALPGLLLDMWAVAVSGGGSWSTARVTVEAALALLRRDGSAGGGGTGSDEDVLPGEDERAEVEDVLALATAVGVPAAPLLRRAASDIRLARRTEGLVAAERLGVRLMLPLGTCLLPAFVLVGVVPVVVALLGSVVGA